MKREPELIKKILEYVEEEGPGDGPGKRGFLPNPSFEGFTDQQVAVHIGLCHQPGYVTFLRNAPYLVDLTAKGHDMLDFLRNNDALGDDMPQQPQQWIHEFLANPPRPSAIPQTEAALLAAYLGLLEVLWIRNNPETGDLNSALENAQAEIDKWVALRSDHPVRPSTG